jgi:hypothetical protein
VDISASFCRRGSLSACGQLHAGGGESSSHESCDLGVGSLPEGDAHYLGGEAAEVTTTVVGTHRRAEAITRARDLGLLAPSPR